MSFNTLINWYVETTNYEKIRFFGTFFVAVFVSYAILYAIDFYPEVVTKTASDTSENTDLPAEASAQAGETVITESAPIIEETVEEVQTTVAYPLPERIIFDRLDKEVPVLNPESREIADLDQALLSGAVRHPDSADFNEPGNVFILAHSSYLPNVINKHFQAFNGIQNLTWGDKIRVQSADTEYVYRVEKVYEASATEVFVPFTPGEARLTLATCDSFGSIDDRFIVEARLVDTVAL